MLGPKVEPRSPSLSPVSCCPLCKAVSAQPVWAHRDGIGLVHCDACGLVRATATYATAYLDHDYYGQMSQRQTDDSSYRLSRKRRSVSLFDGLSGGAVRATAVGAAALDLGCGTGTLLDALAELGWLTEGVERSPRAAASAARRHRIHDVDIESATADLGRRYALITMAHVLEHLRDATAGLRFAARHLARGGLLLVEVPNWNDWARPLWGRHYRPLELGDHVSFFDRATLSDAIDRAGLAVETTWAGPQGATIVMPSVLSALDLGRAAVQWLRGNAVATSVAGPRATIGETPSRLRSGVLATLDRFDPFLQRTAGRSASWGANLVAVAGLSTQSQ